jgi:multiple antibiotic resistance protein
MDFSNFTDGTGTISYFLKSLVSLFVVVDAIGNVPVFMTLLERFEEAEREAIIKKAALAGCLTLMIVSLTGRLFFRILGIGFYSFRMAAGILLMIVSLEMLQGKKTRTQSSADDERHYAERDEISIIPLAIPLLTGPGALTTGIIFFNTGGNLINRIVLMMNMGLVYLTAYLILVKANAVFKFLGKTGTRVAVRIMGLLLLSVSVQFIIEGLIEAFPLLVDRT